MGRGGEVSTARPRTSSPQKFVSADDKSKHKHAQPFITRTNLLTLALYMSHSGGSFGYRGIAATAMHAVCVFVLDRFLRGNFSRKFWGWRGQKFLGKKNMSLTRKFSGKISSPKISSGNVGSDSPSRGNFEAQNFLETTGNFTRKFWDHLIIEVKSVPFPSTG